MSFKIHKLFDFAMLMSRFSSLYAIGNDITKNLNSYHQPVSHLQRGSLVAGAWTERQKMFLGGSFLKLADDNKYIKNPEAQNREVRGF